MNVFVLHQCPTLTHLFTNVCFCLPGVFRNNVDNLYFCCTYYIFLILLRLHIQYYNFLDMLTSHACAHREPKGSTTASTSSAPTSPAPPTASTATPPGTASSLRTSGSRLLLLVLATPLLPLLRPLLHLVQTPEEIKYFCYRHGT